MCTKSRRCYQRFWINHKDHIKLRKAWVPKIGIKLKAGILSKLRDKLIFIRALFHDIENLEVEQLMLRERFHVCFH